MEPAGDLRYPPWIKCLLSVFIVFHLTCVIAWLFPNPSVVKNFLLSRTLYLPGRDRDPKSGEYRYTHRRREVVRWWMTNTFQWQDWAMFAPNPLQATRYVDAEVTFQDGTKRLFGFPRLSQLNFIEAWIEKRYRKYQYQLIDLNQRPWNEDLARHVARRMNDPANPPARVTINKHEALIPRHDRPEIKGALWVDYSKLLRREARYTRNALLDYTVRPEDLR